MSNSIRHQERRRVRAKQKAYENRIHRNASRRNVSVEPIGLQISKISWWQRLFRWLRKLIGR